MECASPTVPVDWAKPGGNRKGSVITIPGGSGGSGVDDLKSAWKAYDELRRDFDVIGFAARGCWASGHLPAERDQPDVLLTVPRDKAEYDAATARNRAFIERCRAGAPAIINDMDSASHAMDVEAIRTALRDKDGGVIAGWTGASPAVPPPPSRSSAGTARPA